MAANYLPLQRRTFQAWVMADSALLGGSRMVQQGGNEGSWGREFPLTGKIFPLGLALAQWGRGLGGVLEAEVRRELWEVVATGAEA